MDSLESKRAARPLERFFGLFLSAFGFFFSRLLLSLTLANLDNAGESAFAGK